MAEKKTPSLNAGTNSGRVNAGTSKNIAEDRRKTFAEVYIANGGNATDAAIKAGYSAKTAYSQGQRLLKNVEVAETVKGRRESLMKKYELTSELVTRSIVQELSFDPAKLYGPDGGLKAITDLDEDVRMALTAIEFEQIGSPDAPVFVRKVKWASRGVAREQAMKFLGMFEKDNKQRSGLLGDLPREVVEAIRDRLYALTKHK